MAKKFRDYSVLLPLTPGELDYLLSLRRIDPNGCWTWTGRLDEEGYGRVKLRGQTWVVHRLFHEIFGSHVSVDLVIDHLCDNRACCNPAHHRQSTRSENSKRAKHYVGIHHHNGGRTHCRRGHLLLGHNCIYRWSHNGTRLARVCRTCLNIRRRAYRARRRAAGNRWTGDARKKHLINPPDPPS